MRCSPGHGASATSYWTGLQEEAFAGHHPRGLGQRCRSSSADRTSPTSAVRTAWLEGIRTHGSVDPAATGRCGAWRYPASGGLGFLFGDGLKLPNFKPMTCLKPIKRPAGRPLTADPYGDIADGEGQHHFERWEAARDPPPAPARDRGDRRATIQGTAQAATRVSHHRMDVVRPSDYHHDQIARRSRLSTAMATVRFFTSPGAACSSLAYRGTCPPCSCDSAT